MAVMPAATTGMAAMTAVATMMKHVQKRACEEEEQRQPGKRMDAVLGEQEEQRDSRKRQEHEHRTRTRSIPVSD